MRVRDLRNADAADAALAVALFALAAVEALAGSPGLARGPALMAAAAYTLPLAVRRRLPLATAAMVLAVLVALDTLAPDGEQITIVVACAIAVYSLGRHLPPRLADGAFATWALVLGLAVVADDGPRDPAAVEITVAVLLILVPWGAGRALRSRAVRLEALSREAEELRRDRDALTRDAVAAERTRLARELHDVVTHAVSVVAVQTQAVRLRLSPSQSREAEDLHGVEIAAREAMDELRRLLGVLRSDAEAPPLEPQPGLDQLDRLIERIQATGTPVRVSFDGEPVPLSPGLDLTAYRVIQEGITNAIRHAPGAPIAISVRYGAALGLRVVDAGGAHPPAPGGAGVGLAGIRERVALYGGRVEARELPDGGFILDVSLPLAESRA